MGMRKIKLASGAEYEVPEENFEAAMQALDAKGVKFNADVRPEPEEPGRSTPFVEPNPNMTGERMEPKGVLEQLLEGTEDAVSGFTHGATLHNDATIGDLYGKGDAIRARNAEGSNRNPNVYGAAEMAGGFLPNVLMGGAGMARQGLSTMGRAISNAGSQGVQGMAQGYARGYGDSDPEASTQERAAAGLENAGEEGVLSALLSGAGSGLGAAAGWGRELWESAGNKARAAAVGFKGQDLKKLAKSKGLDFVTEDVGALPDELGVTNRILPQSKATYADRLGKRAEQANAEITQSTQDASAQGVRGPGFIDKPGMVSKVRQERNAVQRGPLGDRDARAAALENVATGMEQQPLSTPADLRALKTAYDEVAYPSALQGSSESLQGQAHATGGNVVREQLRDAMGYALPETNQMFTQGNIDYGHAATLSGVARDAAAEQYAGGGLMGNIGAAAAGGGIGAAFGHPASGAALGLARPAYAAGQNYGADLGANISRGMEGLSGAASRFGNAAGGSSMGSAVASQTSSEDQRKRAGEARGYLGAQAVEMILERNPEALGEYANELREAQQNGNINGALYKLYMREPEFRSRVYPQIQQLTRASE